MQEIGEKELLRLEQHVVGNDKIGNKQKGKFKGIFVESCNAEHWDIIDYPGVTSGDVFDLFRRTKGDDYDFIGILFSQIFPLGIQNTNKCS